MNQKLVGALEALSFNRYEIDLDRRRVSHERVSCSDMEDVLGGIGRGFKLLESRRVSNAYCPEAALVNLAGSPLPHFPRDGGRKHD